MKRTSSNSYRSSVWRRHIISIFVWVGTVACVVLLFRQRTQRFEVLGFAQGQVRQIAATCSGRLESVPVQLFDKVSLGDTVAVINTVLDDENLEAELAVVSAEIQHLMAELIPTQDRLLAEAAERETDKIEAQRRFSVDVENTRLRILELTTLLESDRIMLEDLELDIKSFTIQDRLQTDDAALYELQKLKIRRNTLAKKIKENEHLLTQTEQDLKQAQQRRSEFAQRQPQHPSVDGALEVIHKAIEVQKQRMNELNARREKLVLKSPFDGIVSQIQGRVGETVSAGEPILTMAEDKPREITAYVSENQARQIQKGTVVELIKTSEPAQVAKSEVTYLGPNINQMPVRLWRNPNIPQWGQPILIKIPPGLKLIPGEIVGIREL